MKNNFTIFLLGVAAFCIVSVIFFRNSIVSSHTQEELNQAAEAYNSAEQAKTIGERKDGFNQALKLYANLEEKYQPTMGTGKLYFNLGNCYFQLAEYPMASWYYHKAAKLMPRNPRIKAHLDLVNDKLAVEETNAPSVFEKIFLFQYLLSLPEKLQLFTFLCFCAWGFASLFLWIGGTINKYATIIGTALCLCLILSLGYNFYYGSVEAILIRSTGLYRDAGFQYTRVVQEPVLSGSKVEVLETKEEGRWLKILTPNGTLGYVPGEAIKII